MSGNNPIWFKGTTPDALMHELTAGNDYILDKNIVHHDAAGSMAHARMLHQKGYLANDDITSIKYELKRIYEEGLSGEFMIEKSFEDVHSAIEAQLIDRIGESGKRIHVGRSRNDQILLCMRLYTRETVIGWIDHLYLFIQSLKSRIEKDGDILMPGYTHMQRGMPSSVGMWLQAFLEESVELLHRGNNLLEELNVNPLGGAAGFGVTLDTNPDIIMDLLGFRKRHLNPINANNSRGRYELRALNYAKEIASMLEKFAVDIMLGQTSEYNFWTLPEEYSTGSSIMPQKRNLDIAELLRSRGSKINGAIHELASVLAKLPSSYHRDLQYSKEPIMRSNDELHAMISMSQLILENLLFKKESLENAVTPELYTTYAAFDLVGGGMPFRDAYGQIGKSWKDGTFDHTPYLKKYSQIQEKINQYNKILIEESENEYNQTNIFKNHLASLMQYLFN